MQKKISGMFLVVLAVVLSIVPALTQTRFALVVGNKNYSQLVGPLKNPFNDVDLVGKALAQIGFQVTTAKDADRARIMREVSDLATKLGETKDAIGFVYYSGHGISRPRDHTNYIIPLDIRDMTSENVWWNAISLDQILRELQGAAPNAAIFVVFDACRSELRLPAKSAVKGFEPVAEQNGIFIAFSTSPSDTASDVGERSGPYAKALASELVKPGQDHLHVFQNVKERVYSATVNVQRPWENNGLVQLVYLAGKPKDPPKPIDEAAIAWQKFAMFTSDPRILENYIAIYDGTEYAEKARQRLANLNTESPTPVPENKPRTPASKIVISIVQNSPIYAQGDLIKIKLNTISSHVKASAMFPFGPPQRSAIEASYSISEGGLYIPYRVPMGTQPGRYSIPVYVQELNSKLEERHVIEVEIKGAT